MIRPESRVPLIVLSCLYLIYPLLAMSLSVIWWPLSTLPILVLLNFFSFLSLKRSHFILVVLLGGMWFDVMVGFYSGGGLVYGILNIILLPALFQILANRSFVSDVGILVVMYGSWLLVRWSITAVGLKIDPAGTALVMSWSTFLIGLSALILLLGFVRIRVRSIPVIPKALL